MSISKDLKLIITIVAKNRTEKVLDALEKEGVKKSTVLLGRMISDDNPTLFLNLKIEPQCEIIYTIVSQQFVDRVFGVILEAGKFNKPHHGIALVLDIEKVGGILPEASLRSKSQ
ncbi:MAG: P-II family nitrogen regulator [Syntrophomonadaceae bacterium]|jgi:nitrogen regulatory protein P-II 1|nr:P-II family nitrogen regulator [Syntrophomonadaceae bacterium]